MLKNKIKILLQKQGRESMLDDVMKDFRIEQLEEMVEKQIDLVDMDRWVAIEKITKCKLNWDEASDIISKLWDYDIEVLELI